MGIGQGKPRGKRHAERIRVRGARHTGNDRKREDKEGTIYRAPTGERLKRHRKRKDKKGTMYRAPTGERLKKHRKRKDKIRRARCIVPLRGVSLGFGGGG